MNDVADDLFAGAGGWDVGAQMLDIHGRGIENMAEARATRDAARLTTIHDDVWTFVPDGKAVGKIASPPCPTFSMSGKGSGRKALDSVLAAVRDGAHMDLDRLRDYAIADNDDRTRLVLTPLHFATRYEYEWLAWEQVPAVRPVWQACAGVLRAKGWHVWTGPVRSEQHGVPQTRTREVLIGSRRHRVGPPTPTHSRYYSTAPDRLDLGVPKWLSMAAGLGWGMEQRPSYTVTGGSGHAAASGIEWGGASVRQRLIELATSDDHERWRAKGWGLNARLSPTITGGGTATGGGEPIAKLARYSGRPDWTNPADRRDSIRLEPYEAGILQSFPADHPWQGSKGRQYLQAGNAVPPLMATAILKAARCDYRAPDDLNGGRA